MIDIVASAKRSRTRLSFGAVPQAAIGHVSGSPDDAACDEPPVAVAHSILVAAYWMPTRDEPYHDLGADWQQRRNNEAHTRRLIAQLEHLDHTVIIDKAA